MDTLDQSGSATSSRVLVTGGAGFIGANVVRILLNEGYTLTVLDNFVAGVREYLDGLALELVQGDILDQKLIQELIADHDAIVHLAAQTGVPGSLAAPQLDCDVNVRGTLNLLEACRVERARAGTNMRFVFASSNAPLGRQSPPAAEDKVAMPISPYGASKLAGEAYCLAYHGSWNLGTVALRFGNVYGPFSAHKNSVVAKFFKDARRHGTVTVEGDGQQTRDFVFVGDLARAIVLALRSDVSGEIFQIATGRETSIEELADLTRSVVGQELTVERAEGRQGDIRKNFSAIRKARELLHWEPEVELEVGMPVTWQWFREWDRLDRG